MFLCVSKNQLKLRLRTNSQITIGDPIIEVTAFIGNVKSLPGNWAMISQNNKIIAPSKIVLQNKVKWLLVWKINFAMCGTANPMNAIGPTKAVILPAKMLVAIMISIRVLLKFIPKLFAYFSPKSNASKGLITKKLML